MLTLGIDDTSIIELEQELASCVLDVHEIVNQKFNVAMDISGFIAVEAQSGRHDWFPLF